MIVGRSFAIGHIPKTAGDAVHAWCRALNDSHLIVDECQPGLGKHDTFVHRSEAHGKRYYVLGIRRLPEWTLSLMHEDSRNARLARDWGFQSGEEMLSPRSPLRLALGDWHLARMRQGVEVTHWLRAGPEMMEDLIATLTDVYRPLGQRELERMAEVRPKPPRSYDHEVRTTWTRDERELLYRMNPQWAAVEALVYGGMW